VKVANKGYVGRNREGNAHDVSLAKMRFQDHYKERLNPDPLPAPHPELESGSAEWFADFYYQWIRTPKFWMILPPRPSRMAERYMLFRWYALLQLWMIYRQFKKGIRDPKTCRWLELWR